MFKSGFSKRRLFCVRWKESTWTNASGTVKWQEFEYVELGEKRKLQLVEMQTCPGEIFLYFIELLERFPLHRFRTKWQHEQLQNLLDNLPFGHLRCIHDHSENYSCQEQDQIQLCYYGQTQTSLRMTVLHRHALLAIDREESSDDDHELSQNNCK